MLTAGLAVPALVYTPAGRIAGLLPRLSRGVRVEYEYTAATSTFSESRGGQEGNGCWLCWLTGAVSVVFVGFSNGSSAGNKIGETNTEKLS